MDGWRVPAFSIALCRLLLAFIYWHLGAHPARFPCGIPFSCSVFLAKKIGEPEKVRLFYLELFQLIQRCFN